MVSYLWQIAVRIQEWPFQIQSIITSKQNNNNNAERERAREYEYTVQHSPYTQTHTSARKEEKNGDANIDSTDIHDDPSEAVTDFLWKDWLDWKIVAAFSKSLAIC